VKRPSGVAPGAPGATARWNVGEKSAIGTSITESSRVWFSFARGALSEVFYPAPDRACLRALGFIVTDGARFVSDEVSAATHETRLALDAPLVTSTSVCVEGRYRLEKEILCDPHADVIVQRVRLFATSGVPADYRLFSILEPHLGEKGDDNVGEVGEHKGATVLFASRSDSGAMALVCSAPWLSSCAGFVETCDPRDDLRAHGELTRSYARAEHGNVILAGEVDHLSAGGCFTMALGFGATTAEAAHAARAALERGFETIRADFEAEWTSWSESLRECLLGGAPPALWTRSTVILKSLEAKRVDGGRVAALATPWGASKGPGMDGTYHLVWTRDLVECLGALLAAGARREVEGALRYLRGTQEADGHWPQNMRLSGEAFWNHTELDEVALPVVFLHLVERDGLLGADALAACWPMVRAAAGYLASTGPSTERDRWEDTSGVTPFTIATEIVALLIAAEMAERRGEAVAAAYLRDLADEWNDLVDTLLYRRGGVLATHVGVDGYYVRARQLGQPFAEDLDVAHLPKNELSPDALALVRFGLRAADDPRIVSTVTVIDAVLQTDFDGGPCWRRYPGDEYGEHDDGAPFDGHGIGRPWPLFTGERAHYEIARGRIDRATSLLHTMESFASASGMLPEQVWDQAAIPSRHLVRGAPSGSAAPLGWAHGEYTKLCRSLMDGAVFDMPAHARARYVASRSPSAICTWRPGTSAPAVPRGKQLRVSLAASGTIEWTDDDWASTRSAPAIDTGLGIFYADVPTTEAGELRVRVRPGRANDAGADTEQRFVIS
jgi:glucoamylase